MGFRGFWYKAELFLPLICVKKVKKVVNFFTLQLRANFTSMQLITFENKVIFLTLV